MLQRNIFMLLKTHFIIYAIANIYTNLFLYTVILYYKLQLCFYKHTFKQLYRFILLKVSAPPLTMKNNVHNAIFRARFMHAHFLFSTHSLRWQYIYWRLWCTYLETKRLRAVWRNVHIYKGFAYNTIYGAKTIWCVQNSTAAVGYITTLTTLQNEYKYPASNMVNY